MKLFAKGNIFWVLGLIYCMLPFLSGCAAVPLAAELLMPTKSTGFKQETGKPINTENISKLIKGKSTKTDVIELFGMPENADFAGAPPGTDKNIPGSPILHSGTDEIYAYKHCVSGSEGAWKTTGQVLFSTNKSEVKESCEQLAILLNKNEVVTTFAYYPDDPVSADSVKKLVKGKSTKLDIIDLFGAPSAINGSGTDEIYNYKNCIQATELNSAAVTSTNVKTSKDCKELVVFLDKKTGRVKIYNFKPYNEQNNTKAGTNKPSVGQENTATSSQ